MTPLDAVKACLNASVSPLAIEQIRSVVEGLIKRSCSVSTISACLQAIDADFDKSSNAWSIPSIPDEPLQEEQAFSA